MTAIPSDIGGAVLVSGYRPARLSLVRPLAQWLRSAALSGEVKPYANPSRARDEYGRSFPNGPVARWCPFHPVGTPEPGMMAIVFSPLDHIGKPDPIDMGGAMMHVSAAALLSFVKEEAGVTGAEADRVLSDLLCDLFRLGVTPRPVHAPDSEFPWRLEGMLDPINPDRCPLETWVRPWGVEVYASIFRVLGNSRATGAVSFAVLTALSRIRAVVAHQVGRASGRLGRAIGWTRG